MKASSTPSADYQSRLNRVVDYIYDHLEEDIGLNRLAEVACLSPYHWHRIYAAMRGETIAATVKRLRLQRAADRLANSELSIKVISERAGYASVAAFSRAFKEVYRQSPAAYRASGSHAEFKAANESEDTSGFEVFLDQVPRTRCACVSHRGSYMQIDRAMATLFGELIAQNLAHPESRMIAVFHDDPDAIPESELRSQACSPVGDHARLQAPLEETVLRGGPYARLRYRGPYADMKDAYRWLFGVWLPGSKREAANAPCFEEYLNNPRDVPPTELLTDICLPLQADA